MRGDFNSQIEAHKYIKSYVKSHNCRIMFISSANVLILSSFPSYEYDKTLSESVYGHFKIKIENIILQLPIGKFNILRLPMILVLIHQEYWNWIMLLIIKQLKFSLIL